jgi:metal-sulfur cluster biosynthetic enzyme
VTPSSDGRRAAVLEVLNDVLDPCSVSIGKPIGLVDMGIVETVDVEGGHVGVTLLPTFPDCLFLGVFEEKIEMVIRTLPWCRSVLVAICPAEHGWDESRLSPGARALLGRRNRTSPKAEGVP